VAEGVSRTEGFDVRMVKVDNSGHFFPEEQPEVTARELTILRHNAQ
jgi:pimeloyl-ACP methyl ester carboxylesterase